MENVWVVSLKSESGDRWPAAAVFKREPTQKELFTLVWKAEGGVSDSQLEGIYKTAVECDFDEEKLRNALEDLEIGYFEHSYSDFCSFVQFEVTKTELLS